MNSLDKAFTIVDINDLQNEHFFNQLSEEINQMILTNFETLVQLLYRIDVSESKVKMLLNQQPNEDAGKIIARLIIERQLQKIKFKNETANDVNRLESSSDAESW